METLTIGPESTHRSEFLLSFCHSLFASNKVHGQRCKCKYKPSTVCWCFRRRLDIGLFFYRCLMSAYWFQDSLLIANDFKNTLMSAIDADCQKIRQLIGCLKNLWLRKDFSTASLANAILAFSPSVRSSVLFTLFLLLCLSLHSFLPSGFCFYHYTSASLAFSFVINVQTLRSMGGGYRFLSIDLFLLLG